ncbi:MAG TPA: glucokinase [Elusimicrobiota bacterium]|nr:glucokinase [Elusimicrobiota bacterium]
MAEAMILAGDVGGTNTRLALFKAGAAELKPAVLEIYPSRNYASLGEALEAFVAKHRAGVVSACLGVAGPVKDGRVEATNLPWEIDARGLSPSLSGAPVRLLNDLEANAWGLAELAEKDFAVLNAGASGASGHQALIAAGTGLGQALMIADGTRLIPVATEGGHMDFAPRSDEEAALLDFLRRKFGRVSYERVVSGPGLVNIYDFLRQVRKMHEPAWLAAEMKSEDPSAAISTAALESRAEICARALDIFVSVYGAQAGNLALSVLARGGVFLGGGIAPKILPKLREPAFMKAFLDKGRMRPVLESIPVRVVLNDHAALLGAARCALAVPGVPR